MELIRIEKNNIGLISDVYSFLSALQNEYTGFKLWFYGKVIPGLENDERKIFAIKDGGNIIAVIILKNGSDEKKICTLRVAEEYRRKKLATLLLKVAFSELRCAKPIITVSAYHIQEFAPLLKKHGFTMYAKYPDYYKQGIIEYAFNGPLNEEAIQENCA